MTKSFHPVKTRNSIISPMRVSSLIAMYRDITLPTITHSVIVGQQEAEREKGTHGSLPPLLLLDGWMDHWLMVHWLVDGSLLLADGSLWMDHWLIG